MPLIYGQSMLYFGQNLKKNDHPKLRSLPGHASVILASAPALLHEVQLAQASIHVTYVCVRKVDTMYISNLYMYQKSFEVPTIWSHARKRKYFLVHPVTQAQVSEVWREVWEMNITFCFKGTFCRQILSCFKHCFVT